MSSNLKNWRSQIDRVDGKILKLLSKRFEIVSKIGKYKKENSLAVLDKKRRDEILKSNLQKSKPLNLPKDFINKLFSLIHEHSLKIQKQS